MADHQWLHDEHGPVIITSLLEMTAVLRCAASLADHEGMRHTAQRLRNDANTVEAVYAEQGSLVVLVQ